MTYALRSEGGLDYEICKYGTARGQFRGPERMTDMPYVAVLGGNAAFGRFIAEPFPTLLERDLGQSVVNLGALNASVDMYLNDPDLMKIARGAEQVVVQITGAHNLSNRFYKVHPRRNDRFIRASALLRSIYAELDFTEFHFTRHLLSGLYRTSPKRFGMILDELRDAWVKRMELLMSQLDGQAVLLWMADNGPEDRPNMELEESCGPLFVTRAMVEAVRPQARRYLEVLTPDMPRGGRTIGMIFGETETGAANRMLPVATHAQAAKGLAAVLSAS
ncbi:DUF6473 family protein [Actibacterium sp. 188UL27-1]|uniref:DUF6473 family protein n=1 Tax=Actibacterium sp. 188UL27-1 TaxID=2786961 RepID=UPI00195EDF0A|nr:DUF6473 family protein [Actibacterium sp. 188UL27-1]MBM7069792.1 hypothetical protein [Actibacterium sp. 188UL27-1]